MNNSTFSTTACYSLLSMYAGESSSMLSSALLKMVIALIDYKKYSELDPKTMSQDFYNYYGFSLPYHPMQSIIQLGIKEQYFEYNLLLKKVFPIPGRIDSGDYMELISRKNAEYLQLIEGFDNYLKEKYSLHCSKEELSDHIQVFIQRYGLVSNIDQKIFKTIKNDFYFAEYLLYCYESDNEQVLRYVEEYSIGCAFAETLTFSVPTEHYKTCHAKVFLDSGFIFALLGISSKNRSDNFQELFEDMCHLGMKPHIFLHTYNEIAGIIDTAKEWIGNPNYDPVAASETAYFFVTNNWSYQKATELLGDLKRILTEDYHIIIDDTPYPDIANIRTRYEADIKQLIIEAYSQNTPNFSAKDKDFTISQDARSLFMLLHFDDGNVAHTLPDVKNIFITTNQTLAKVGRKLSAEISHGSTTYIPIALTDLAWGILVWANSPAKVAPFSRAKIISAAYAAFQPSPEILKRLNQTLARSQALGHISPEMCYFLKTNSVALKLLAQKTQNDEHRYSDQTPFEIIKSLRDEGYQQGIDEKQKEVDSLSSEKDQMQVKLAIEKQRNVINNLEAEIKQRKDYLSHQKEHANAINEHLHSLGSSKNNADSSIKNHCNVLKIIMIIVLFGYIIGLILLFVKIDLVATIIATVLPILIGIIGFACNQDFRPQAILSRYKLWITPKIYSKFAYDENKFNLLNDEYQNTISGLRSIEEEIRDLERKLHHEKQKIDSYSIDIGLL